MEHFSEVSGKDLQGLLRTCGQVVHPDIFILTARRYHVPAQAKRDGGIGGTRPGSLLQPCRRSYLLFWLQSQPNTAAGCLYLWRILPSTVRMTLLAEKYNVCDTHSEYKWIMLKTSTYQNPSPLQVAILFESLWLQDMQNIPFLPCWGETDCMCE